MRLPDSLPVGPETAVGALQGARDGIDRGRHILHRWASDELMSTVKKKVSVALEQLVIVLSGGERSPRGQDSAAVA